jgi:hypothetical protein
LQAGQIMSFLRCLFMQALQKRCWHGKTTGDVGFYPQSKHITIC